MKMLKRSYYLNLLMAHTPEWIAASAANPTAYMTKTDILLHYVALRRLGVSHQKVKAPVAPTENQIQAGMMALLVCSASDLGSFSPYMYDMYVDEVKRVYMAMTSAKP
jgi:hypothetical protein